MTKYCVSRRSRLQNGQASLRRYISIQQHILPLPNMVCKLFLRIFKCVLDTHILIDVVILLLFLNNIYIFTLYNSNVNILWNFFCTELKYVLLEGKLFHPRCYSYLLNIHYCYSLTGGRVCNKGLCFKTEPCAGWPGQPAKMCLNIRSCVCNKYIMYVMGKLTITKH